VQATLVLIADWFDVHFIADCSPSRKPTLRQRTPEGWGNPISGIFTNDRLNASGLIAAGVVLRGNKHQTRTGRNRLRARAASKCVQDADHGGIGGENAESNGCDHGEEQSDGHKKPVSADGKTTYDYHFFEQYAGASQPPDED
jgi:hypothetical protein